MSDLVKKTQFEGEAEFRLRLLLVSHEEGITVYSNLDSDFIEIIHIVNNESGELEFGNMKFDIAPFNIIDDHSSDVYFKMEAKLLEQRLADYNQQLNEAVRSNNDLLNSIEKLEGKITQCAKRLSQIKAVPNDIT